ncbi:MAG: NACHT domain-containing protein [Acidobacteria bacterium]|nr:NACHT domain-containing protein [Acidobacteriota bacterium]
MTDYFAYWKGRIRHDLASFGDPGASVDVDGSDRRFRASWTMRSELREATFSISRDEGVWVTAGSARRIPYRAFVSGPGMADLRHVARMIQSTRKPTLYIAAQATSPNGSGPAIDVLTELLADEADATRVMMVTGGAGAGKTSVLRELVRRGAEAYLNGSAPRLLLYVNAQGRPLARLNEALATELQDLRVGLTYHSIAVLAQLGVLVPVIDGFDELLGVSGYDDAFSSLGRFIEQLHGEGQILASARSTYYEEEFLERAGRASATGDQAWSHVPVRIQEWSDDDRQKYLDRWSEQRGWSSSEAQAFRARVTRAFKDQVALAQKPMFFTRVVDLLQHDASFAGGDDLLRTLVREYSSRELKEKLLDRQSRPLMTGDQFEDLLQELAEEMWNQETRGLDVGSIRFVAEYFVHDAGLPDAARQVIVERLPAMAFLGRGDGPAERGGIAFEHELFFFYFLARAIAARLDATGVDLRAILGRSALPEEVADRVARDLAGSDAPAAGNRLQERLDRLSKAAEQESRRAAQVRENAGLLVMALMREHGGRDAVEGCKIRSVVFPGSHLRNVTLNRCTLDGVDMRRTDLAATRFVGCEARAVRLYEPRVSRESTRLELAGLGVDDVAGIRVVEDGGDTNYEPSFIIDALRSCGTPIAEDPAPKGLAVPDEEMKLMEGLMRAYRRTALVCLQDDNLSGLFADRRWPRLQEELLTHGIVKLEERATRGRPKQFLRPQFLPKQIMAGRVGRPDTEPQIRSLWEALATSAQ